MLSNKTLIWISLSVSVISLTISIIVLANFCPTQNLKFDYMGVIVGILALLVTALIGAQVGQYVFVDKKIEKISRAITRTIARKVAQEEAKRVALGIAESVSKETASATTLEVVGGLPDDVSLMMRGKDMMNDAADNAHTGELMEGINCIMEALSEFKKIDYEVLYKSAIDDALKELIRFFEHCKGDKGGLRIQKGKRKDYEAILKDIRSDYLAECQSLLALAEEKEYNFDEKLSEQEIKDMFNDSMDEAKK